MKTILAFVIALSSASLAAKDLGFRYTNGKCSNGATEGLNPGYIGQCGDFRHVTISGLAFDSIDLSGSRFDAADVQGSTFMSTNLSGTAFPGANLSGVDLNGAVVHSVSFKGAILVNTHFTKADLQDVDFSAADMSGALLSYMKFPNAKFNGTKLTGAVMDHVNLAGADLTAVVLENVDLQNSVLDGADLTRANLNGANLTAASLKSVKGDATNLRAAVLTKAALTNARLTNANLRSTRLNDSILTSASVENSDLRSATMLGAKVDGANFNQSKINKRTVLPTSDSNPDKMGLVMARGGSVYVLWDKTADDKDLLEFKKFLESSGLEVALAPGLPSTMTGKIDFGDSSAILHISTGVNSYQKDLPKGLQLALVQFVKEGGTYVGTEWLSYMVLTYKFLADMRDLVLLDNTTTTNATKKLTPVAAKKGHPVLEDITGPVSLRGGYTSGKVHAFTDHPVETLMTDPDNGPALMVRELGEGRIVHINFAPTFEVGELNQPDFRKIALNAINWN